MTQWQYFPRSTALPAHLGELLDAMEHGFSVISADEMYHESDVVTEILRPHLESIGYEVEKGKRKNQKVPRPVLFGANGTVDKQFEVDAFHAPTGTVVEIEAGRGVRNHQFLKDFFEACCIQDAEYLVIAVLNEYTPASMTKNPGRDFDEVVTFFDSLYASNRLTLPLKGILIVGYDNTGLSRRAGRSPSS